MAFVNKVNGIPIDDFLAVNPDYTKVPALDKYGNPYLFEDGTPQYTVISKSDEEISTNFPTIDPFSGRPYLTDPNAPVQPIGPAPPDNYYDEVPTRDLFNQPQGQLLGSTIYPDADSYQAAVEKDMNSFSTTEVPTVDPFSGQSVSGLAIQLDRPLQLGDPIGSFYNDLNNQPFQPYESGPSNVGIFTGPSYDKYSEARTSAYANSPSKFDYDIAANQAAGQFIQDRAREIYGDNVFGKGIGTLGAVAGVPLAMFSSPFHEAAQVIMEGRMKPGSGIEGFYKAFMNELPFSTALNRGAGVLKSIPEVGEPIYQGAYKLGEGLKNLTSRNPVLSSLTKNFNDLTFQEMNQIRNTPTEELIERARSSGQEGGMGYLLGF